MYTESSRTQGTGRPRTRPNVRNTGSAKKVAVTRCLAHNATIV